MIIKSNDLNTLKKEYINFYLFYGANLGLIEETIEKNFKKSFSKNITNYDETDLINNINQFKEKIFNRSFFGDDELIIINRASSKILPIIEEIVEKKIEDKKIIIKTGLLEKKSKLRNYFEKSKKVAITPFYEDNEQTLLFEIQKSLKEKKIKISNEIINLIIRRSKGNRINILNEIEKISLFSQTKSQVTFNDILKLTNLVENYDISDFVNQNLSKNKQKTLNILNENILNSEENVLILRTFLNKLKKLKQLKILLKRNSNIEQVLSSFKPPIFWKDKEIIKQQLSKWNLNQIKDLIQDISKYEVIIKKNSNLSNQIINNFILEKFNN